MGDRACVCVAGRGVRDVRFSVCVCVLVMPCVCVSVYKCVPDSLHDTALTHRTPAAPKCQFVLRRLPGSMSRLSEHANLMRTHIVVKWMQICSLFIQIIVIPNLIT